MGEYSWREHRESEGRRKWVVLGASFFTHVIIWGPAWGAGVFQVIFMDEFGKEGDAAKVSVIPTLVPAIMSFVGPLGSLLTNRLGCRLVVVLGTICMTLGFLISAFADSIWFLYATFSLIGAGTGLVFIPSIVIVCDHFVERRPIATAVASSGLGVGIFIFPPLIRLLSQWLGWRWALVVYAGITTLMLGAAFIFAPPPDLFKPQHQRPGKKKVLRVKMLRDVAFLCLLLNNVLLLYGIVGFYIHLPAHAVSIGFTESEASMFPSVAGISTLICRLLSGFLVQRLKAPLSIYAVSMVAAGLAVVGVAFVEAFPLVVLGCLVFGLGSATLGPLLPLIMAELLGPEAIGDGYGYIMVAEGVGSLIGPPVAGALYDSSNSYRVSLCCAGGAMILGSLSMAYPLYQVWKKPPPDIELTDYIEHKKERASTFPPTEESSAQLLEKVASIAIVPEDVYLESKCEKDISVQA